MEKTMAKAVFRMASEDDASFTGKFVVSSKKARSSNDGSADGLGEKASYKTVRDKNKQPNSLPKT